MKILIISYNYYPIISPRAFKWTKIAEYWASKGIGIDVVCVWKPGLLKEENLNGVKIFRVSSGIIDKLRKKYNDANNELKYNKTINGNKIEFNSLITYIRLIYNFTWKKIYWPDHACLWYFPARKKVLNLYKKYNYEKVISVSHPFTDHLISLYLKKINPNFYWIVDVGDPFYFLSGLQVNNVKLYNNLNYIVEKNVLKHANRIMVSPASINEYKKTFSGSSKKMYIGPPVVTNKEEINDKYNKLHKNSIIKLIFIGTLYKEIRNPKYLLKLFNEILNMNSSYIFELHFIGSINDCKNIFLHGIFKKSKVNQILTKADILINLGNNSLYQLPSKVVDYASTGKPILNIVKNINDSSIKFFKKYPYNLNIIEDSEKSLLENSQEILNFIKHLPEKIDSEIIKEFIYLYKIKNVAEIYLSVNQNE